MLHIEEGEGEEDGQRDGLLHDLQLREGHGGITEAVGGDLDEVFEEGDSPAHEGGDEPFFVVQVFEVGVPGESHEYVRTGEK